MAKSYKEVLYDRRWQIKKNAILQRDKFTCCNVGCSSLPNAPLHVHHIDYFHGIDPWDYPDDMFVTLCEKCHNKEKIRREVEESLINVMKIKGFLVPDILALSSKMSDSDFSNTLLTTLRDMQNG